MPALRRRALAWYRRHRRDLPWRRDHDPYRIWVAEIMLQQTRVDVVVPYYERFVARFPDVRTLAAAPQHAVLQSWAGLGYYRRARHLHAAARRIVEEHAGSFPHDPQQLEALPGVGRYTGGAIRSIAFGEPAPILDGNVIRVFARLFGVEDDVTSAAARRRMWDWAAHWAAGRDPGDANQALMELGATCCTKPIPTCHLCPLATSCIAHRSGREQELPRPRRRPASRTLRLEAVLARRRDRILLVRRSTGTLLRDWWELPACRTRTEPDGRAIADRLDEVLHIDLRDLQPVAALRHGILNHRLAVALLTGQARPGAAAWARARTRTARRSSAAVRPPASIASLDSDGVESRWASAAECRALPLSTLARKSLRAAAARDPAWAAFLARGLA